MKFGGSRIIALGVATTAIITLLNPLIIQYNFYLFVLARAIEGTVEVMAHSIHINQSLDNINKIFSFRVLP